MRANDVESRREMVTRNKAIGYLGFGVLERVFWTRRDTEEAEGSRLLLLQS